MDSEELLAQLADIHLPEPVSLWPPAPGWWILAVLLLIGLIYLGRQMVAARTRRKICEYALGELESCYQKLVGSNDTNLDELKLRYLNEVNSVLRRVALVHFPQSNVASLGGVAWVDFIRQTGDSTLLDDDIASALSHGRFQTKCDVNADALYGLGQAWIRSLYLPTKSQATPTEESPNQKDQLVDA